MTYELVLPAHIRFHNVFHAFLLKELEQLVTKVQVNLKETQDCQKIYVDKKIKDKDDQIGDHVYLKVKAK